MTTRHFAWRTLASTEDTVLSKCHAFDLDTPLLTGGMERALCGYKKHTLKLTPNGGTWTEMVCPICRDRFVTALEEV